MGSILFYIVTFVFVIGVLVTVHEFGHFWVARRLGVKVTRFSVGFGKPLLRWQRDNDSTEYVVARIPLGGYVKMLDERNDDDIPEADLPNAFNRKPVGTRIAVVLAGPAFNFLLAIFFYWIVFMIGQQGIAPVIDDVRPATLAQQSGLKAGDQITYIEGKKVDIWGQVGIGIIDAVLGSQSSITLRVTGDDLQDRTVSLSLNGVTPDHMQKGLIKYIGIQPRYPPWPAIIDTVTPGDAADQAGLRAGDEILRFDDEAISSWPAWVEMVKARPGKQTTVQIRRDGASQRLNLKVGQKSVDETNYGFVGVIAKARPDVPESMQAVVQYSALASVGKAVQKTIQISVLTLKMLGKMVVGEASVKNISGPITIAQVAGDSLSIGFVQFLTFMAVISISLGVLNLLPIPVLDGGHLLYYLAELAKGSPVSEKTQIIGQQVGLVLLGLLMTVAFYNDVMRLL